MKARFKESENQMKSIKEGIEYVIPLDLLAFFTWEEIEARCCGDKVVDIEKLKKMTAYSVSLI